MNNSFKTYETVDEFLQYYKEPIRQDQQLKLEINKVFHSSIYPNFLTSAIHLLKFYQKMIKVQSNLNLDSILVKYKNLKRDEVQDMVKMYQHSKTKQSTAIASLDSNNTISNNNNITVSPIIAKPNKASDLDKQLFSDDDDIDCFEVELNLFDLRNEFQSTTNSTKSSGGNSPFNSTTTEPSNNNSTKASDGSNEQRRTSPRKKRNQVSYTEESPKKKRLPPKMKAIDSTLERTTLTDNEKSLLVLQNQVAQLSNRLSIQDILEAVTLQEKINPLCDQLMEAIMNNYKDSNKKQSSKRDGFSVTYSNNMGYHSQNSGLKGFTINHNNKHYHNFNEHKRTEKTVWEQQIWDIGMEIMKLKGLIKNKGEELCMEFGFMRKGDYVHKVWNTVFICVVVI